MTWWSSGNFKLMAVNDEVISNFNIYTFLRGAVNILKTIIHLLWKLNVPFFGRILSILKLSVQEYQEGRTAI
jgi:hypothetical protein